PMYPSEQKATFVVAILLVLLCQGNAMSQAVEPDTVDAAQYFPLSIGNQWHYVDEDTVVSKRWFVAGDTVVADTLYFRLLRNSFDSGGVATTSSNILLRYDSTTATIFQRIHIGQVQYELLWYELPGCLDAEDGRYTCEPAGGALYDVAHSTSDVVVGSDTVENVVVKGFGTIGGSYGFAAGIGLLGRGYEASTASHRLVYAHVDEKTFGQPVTATQTRGDGPLPGATIQSLFPNPASSTIQVRYNSSRAATCAYRVVDILGRIVADSRPRTDCTGEWRVPVDALPAGHYVLIAAVDGVV